MNCSTITTATIIDKCGIERKIFTNQTSGNISNIDGNIRFCEWLINFDSFSFINLKFTQISLNCNNDRIYVFDGKSFEDQLIANIDGSEVNSLLKPVVARSGSMLILYHSEIQSPSTFLLEFTINNCPLNCSGHGSCSNNHCICDKLRIGDACQFESCPNNCSSIGNCIKNPMKSSCTMKTNREYFCHCPPNTIGQSCNIDLNESKSSTNSLEWQILFDNEDDFSARASHASVLDETTETIYIYGGRNYETIFSDLLSYSISKNQWFNLTNNNCDNKVLSNQPNSKPQALWAHTLNVINDSLILFGGIHPNGSFSNELWIYNLSENNWIQPKVDNGIILPGLAHHVSVIVDNQWLYVHGGQLEDSTCSSNIYRINILNGFNRWQLIKPKNGKPYHRQLAAHTAYYSDYLRSIVIFGGMSMSSNRFMKLRNDIHLYNIDKNVWLTLDSFDDDENHVPTKRAFHSMLMIENYLLIFGGYVNNNQSRNDSITKCRDERIYIYNFQLHQWIDLPKITNFPFDGLFSHSLNWHRNHLLVFGGYSRRVHNEIMILSFPVEELLNTSKALFSPLKNLCSIFKNCFDCIISNEEIDSGLISKNFCLWQIKNKSCIDQQLIQSLQKEKNDDYIKNPSHCQHFNGTTGFTFLKYYHSPNFSYPDEVSIITQDNFETSFHEEWLQKSIEKKNIKKFKYNCDNSTICSKQECGNESKMFNIARILGFIHPLGIPSMDHNIVRIYLRSTSSEILFSSNKSSNSNLMKSLISSNTAITNNSFDLHQTFVDIPMMMSDIHQNFFIDFIIKFPIKTVMDPLQYEKINIYWEVISTINSTVNSNSKNHHHDLIVMPFRDEALCHLQTTCNACLSNSGCAWCSSLNICEVRNKILTFGCDYPTLILEPNDCFSCFEANHCEQCVSDSNCEWLPEYETCVRRGRFHSKNNSYINGIIMGCPIECHLKKSQESCLNDSSSDCVWCQSRNQCIHRTTQYPLSLFDFCTEPTPPSLVTNGCEDCPIGSFKNDKHNECQPCNCNNHGDLSKGICHPRTGQCFCQDFTEGINCERCISGYYGDPKNGGNCFLQCSNKALISNATFGHFGFHIRNFRYSGRINIHCLWIFSSAKSEIIEMLNHNVRNDVQAIQIKIFSSMNINCSHSTLMIYDGIPDYISANNYQTRANFLTSICSNRYQNENDDNRSEHKWTAYSGVATVLFISDNLNQGFNGSYQVVNQTIITDDSHQIIWPKSSHSIHYFKNKLIFVGGHLNRRHLALTLFELNNHRWIMADQQPTQKLPPNRYLHASVLIGKKLCIHGGIEQFHSSMNRISNEFWCAFINQIDSDSLKFIWVNLTSDVQSILPPLVGHTLTAIQFNRQLAIFLIGGFSSQHGYFSKQLIYITDSNQWQEIQTKGPAPIGVIAHSTIYHEPTNMIYVFGGIDFKESHKMVISNTLYILDLSTKVWVRQQSSVANSIPPVYVHMAGAFQNYMIIFGGKKQNNRPMPRTVIYAYFFKCNQWILLNNTFDKTNTTSNVPMKIELDSQKSSTIYNNSIYLFETSSTKIWSIETIDLPADLCNLNSNNRNRCLSMNGCSYCMLKLNRSGFCYDDSYPVPEHCLVESISRTITTTNSKCSLKKECYQFTNCVDCTANNYKIDNDQSVKDGGCQWCADCHLANGKCMKTNDTCQWDTDFDMELSSILCSNISLIKPDQCSSRRCLATDCNECLQLNKKDHNRDECIWTKQVYKFIRFGHHAIPTNPIFDWACIDSSIIKYTVMKNVPTIPPLECPARCLEHKTCESCLEETTGDESGSHECVWSELQHECMSPTYSLLRCQHEHCGGFVYRRRIESECPPECESFIKAINCLQMLHCGWCALEGLSIDGVGLCLRGGIFGPLQNSCTNQSLDFLVKQLNYKYQIDKYAKESLNVRWHYLYPPKENECLNNHHTCDESAQDCIDLDDGFMCRCKDGFKMFENNNICKPICQQGCIHGVCVAPNVCQCHFGFIGNDCSIECKCHGHSTCPSIERLDECIECHNNTQGRYCDQCKPFFVGRPSTYESCQSCFQYCHNHSELCFSEEQLSNASSKIIDLANDFDDDHWLDLGSKIPNAPSNKIICINCKNNTEGEKCDRCKLGYFKISDDIRDGCRRCMCNEHGYLCNPFNGENCNCHNNTENDRQCNYLTSKEYTNYINKTYFFKSSQIMTTYSLPCWMLQCSKCKDYFYGIPTNGHQCYRHMYLEKEYCLDPVNQENCFGRPIPLLNGRTTFFGLQPRYMNVDIKLVIYSVEGKVDVFLASKEDMFVVQVDPKNGFHHVFIDKKYSQLDSNISLTFNNTDNYNDKSDMHQNLDDISDYQNISLKHPYKLSVKNLDDQVSSYFIMKNWYEVIILRNLSSRLELTIPYRYHDLRTSRYYMMIRGSFLFKSDSNYGFVVLRQDQNRIDLYIFFCVFLSFFFVFLCLSIFFWRIKQIILMHQNRHRQEIELKHMAKRPFAKITILLDDDDEDHQRYRPFQKTSILSPSIQCTPSKKESFLSHLGFKDSPKIYPEEQVLKTFYDGEHLKISSKPPISVAIEPTKDGQAAIFTTFLQLPSKESSSKNNNIEIAAASTLISIQNCPSIIQKFNTNNKLIDK